MRCLIVSKTHAGKAFCVGALAKDRSNLRLTTNPEYPFLPVDTPFEIGQVWDVSYYPCSNHTPPHVENVIVTQARFMYTLSELAENLPKWTKPWVGGVSEVFDGKTRSTASGSRYVQQDDLPMVSVGFWIPDRNLIYQSSEPYYRYLRFRMKYVGVENPPQQINKGRLVRVSLARWFKPDEADDQLPERCFLQISGVY